MRSNTPHHVQSSDIFVIKQLTTGPRSTNILTEGGRIYTYGVIKDQRVSRREKAVVGPYSMPDFG